MKSAPWKGKDGSDEAVAAGEGGEHLSQSLILSTWKPGEHVDHFSISTPVLQDKSQPGA